MIKRTMEDMVVSIYRYMVALAIAGSAFIATIFILSLLVCVIILGTFTLLGG